MVTPHLAGGMRLANCSFALGSIAINRLCTPKGNLVSVYKSKFYLPLLPAFSMASAAFVFFSASAVAQTQAPPDQARLVESLPKQSGVGAEPGQVSDAAQGLPPLAAKPSYGPPVALATPKASGVVISWEGAPASAPPALVRALDIVSRTYPSIRGARAAIGAASSDVRGAQWQRFPNVSVQTSFVDTGNTVAPSLSVSAPVWTAGRLGASIKRAKATLSATEAQYREVVLGLAVDTAQLYFDIARLSRREVLIQQSLEEHGALVASMERRVAQEVSPLADLELARSRLAQIEQELSIARAQRQASLYAFAELVADPNYEIGDVPSFGGGLALQGRETLMDEALGFDPALQRLQAQILAGRAEVSAAKAAILPQVNAQYSYNDAVGSRVGLVASLETAGGLSRFSAVSSARGRLEALEAQYLTAQRQLRQRVNNDLTEFESASARADVSRNASFTANNVSQSYMRQFIAGRRSWLDVMNSLRETLSARLIQADAEIQTLASFTRLSLRTGRWSPFSGEAQ